MSIFNRVLSATFLAALVCSPSLSAAIITVAKSGADYTTISAAIRAAQPGDVIKIMDIATYEEEVTIDSTKCPLTLTSKDPTSLNKPVIKYQDKIHVGPKTYAESMVDSLITFDQNGALRIIKARNVIIDGIAIDGGGVYPFGYPSVWSGRYGIQHGNAAIALWQTGEVIIRNCDLSNAYFGISFKDRNVGGIFSNPNPADLDTHYTVPLSGYGKTGNHLVERCRIHNNSWGIFFESMWDLGTTIRYNLIYENHHASDAVAAAVYGMTSDEGPNQCGGALFFKDILLSPLAIYNNTFYHNFALLCGHWQAGYHHLVFNNLFGPPFKYWTDSIPSFRVVPMELSPAMPNRIYSCIYSAQYRSPQHNGVYLFDTTATLQGTGGVEPDPGTVISGPASRRPSFPSSANNRWLEMDTAMFISINPASVNFLEPNWADENVKSFIVQQGWEKSGVKNTDGTRADLGAVEQAHGTPFFTGTIAPYPLPVIINGTEAQITFILDEREGSTMTDPRLKLFRLVRTKYKTDTFGANAMTGIGLVIGTADMTDLTVPATPPVKVGPNAYSVTANITGDFAFIEMIIEATGADGKIFTTPVGFLPYRKLDYIFKVDILNKAGGQVLQETHVGDTVVLRITPQSMSEPFLNSVNPVVVTLVSGFQLLEPGSPPRPLAYTSGVTGATEKNVVFSKIPENGFEYITASGLWRNAASSTSKLVFGGTSIKVLPQPSAIGNHDKPSASKYGAILPKEVTINCFDLQGRRIFQKTFLSDMGVSLIFNSIQKIRPGTASKVYLMDISIKDRVSLKQARSVRKIILR